MKGNGLTVSADMLKHHDQDQRGLILTACSPSFRELGVGCQGGNLEELVQRLWRSTALYNGLLCLLSYSTQDHHARAATTHRGRPHHIN